VDSLASELAASKFAKVLHAAWRELDPPFFATAIRIRLPTKYTKNTKEIGFNAEAADNAKIGEDIRSLTLAATMKRDRSDLTAEISKSVEIGRVGKLGVGL
jgi:hypothetical protein